jgi:hypothetical protein
MTTQKQAADILERLAELEAREAERAREAEELRRAREIEQERKGPSAKRVTAEGEAQGQAQCVNEECPELFRRRPVEMTFQTTTQFQRDSSGNVTDRPESDWTHYHLKNENQGRCGNCGDPLNLIRPGAKAWHDGLSRKGASDVENLRRLRNAEITRVEVVTPEVR